MLEFLEPPDIGGHKSHLLKVDETLHIRLIADVEEVRILSDQWHEGNDGRGQLAFQGPQDTVVSRGVLGGWREAMGGEEIKGKR